MANAAKVRRTQEERSARTRLALIEGAISAINIYGYSGASTSLIADQANTSRGAMVHHFATRASLMAEVVRHVFDREMMEYEEIRIRTGRGNRLDEWPCILWTVLSKPSGLAVLEILQATKEDGDLAAKVVPMQEDVERAALVTIRKTFGGSDELALTVMRLMVWSVRGLTIADRYLPKRAETEDAVRLLSSLLAKASPAGTITELERFQVAAEPQILT